MLLDNQNNRATNQVPQDAGGTYTGAIYVTELVGAWSATITPDVTPGTARQILRYPITGNTTLANFAGTAALDANAAIAGSIYLMFSATATVTLGSKYKPPKGAGLSFSGVAGDVYRLDFQYVRSLDRISCAYTPETA